MERATPREEGWRREGEAVPRNEPDVVVQGLDELAGGRRAQEVVLA